MPSRNCRGRRLDWSICKSEQVADLSDPWAKLLFTWLISSADNCGRTEGEPYQVAGMIFPLEMEKGTITVAKVEKWLGDLASKALIIWYKSGRLKYVQLPKFLDHQKLTGNMTETSDYPSPDEASIRAWRDLEQAVCTPAIHGSYGVGSEDKDKDKDSFLSDARTVFAHWQERLGHSESKFTEDRKQKILARLGEGSSVERLKQAIDGCASSKYHMGENDQGRRYDSIELIFRNAGKVDEFADLAVKGNGKRPDPLARGRRIAKALAQIAGGMDPLDAKCLVFEDEWEEVLTRTSAGIGRAL
jgi:hypothetical protein